MDPLVHIQALIRNQCVYTEIRGQPVEKWMILPKLSPVNTLRPIADTRHFQEVSDADSTLCGAGGDIRQYRP